MKNNAVMVLLVVLISVLAGLGILIGIGNAVQVASMPMVERMERIAAVQKDILQKIELLNAKVDSIPSRAAANAPAPSFAPQQPPSEDLNKVYDIPVGKTPVIGKTNARVTVTEFTDLQCPFCARFHPVVKQALEAFPNDARLLVKNYPLPFHPNAIPAAKLTLAANEQGKYAEMLEILLENGADASEAKVKEYAQKLGLNYDKLVADLKNKDAAYDAQIKEDMTVADKSDVRGTPTFFINGKKTMARDPESFKAAIKAALEQK